MEQQSHSTEEQAKDAIEKLPPDETICVILSQGRFYIEGGSAFIRNHEVLLYEGRAGEFKNFDRLTDES